MAAPTGPWRSFLFTPADHARRVGKAFGTGADAVILDLEDAVAVAGKPEARAFAVEALRRPRPCRGFVRINASATEWCFGDLEAVVGPWLDGILLPKLESAAELRMIDWVLGQLERKAGMVPGTVDLMAIIETGLGISRLGEISEAPTRLRRLCFGAGDYTLDMGLEWSPEGEEELHQARSAIVLASRAGGLEAPVDTVFIHLRETAAFAASAARARALGFQGKLCIHPDQVGPVNDAFTPTGEVVAHAERVVAAFEEAERSGSASIQVDGYFVDYPIVEKARRTLAMTELVRSRGRMRGSG